MKPYINQIIIFIVFLIVSSLNSSSQITPIRTIDLGNGSIEHITISPDGTKMAVTGLITGVWDIETGKQIRDFPHPYGKDMSGLDGINASDCAAFSQNGKMVVIGYIASGWGWGDTILWDIDSGQQIQRFRIEYNPNYDFPFDFETSSICFNKEATLLYTITDGFDFREWDINNGNLIKTFTTAAKGNITILSNGQQFLVDRYIYAFETGNILYNSGSYAVVSLDGTKFILLMKK
jgi:WD40 repeat protein